MGQFGWNPLSAPMCFSIPFPNLAMAEADTEAGKKRKELAQIMTSRQVPKALDRVPLR